MRNTYYDVLVVAGGCGGIGVDTTRDAGQRRITGVGLADGL